jgi:hypothetical protein
MQKTTPRYWIISLTVRDLTMTDMDWDIVICRQRKVQAPKETRQEVEPRSYAEAIRGPSKEEDKKTQEEDYRDTAPPRRFKSRYQQKLPIEIPQEEGGLQKRNSIKKIFHSQVSNYFSWFMLFMLQFWAQSYEL